MDLSYNAAGNEVDHIFVSLREEGVDLSSKAMMATEGIGSPSARREWI